MKETGASVVEHSKIDARYGAKQEYKYRSDNEIFVMHADVYGAQGA